MKIEDVMASLDREMDRSLVLVETIGFALDQLEMIRVKANGDIRNQVSAAINYIKARIDT